MKSSMGAKFPRILSAVGCSLLLVLVVSLSLGAKSKGEMQFKTVEVKHFTVAQGVDLWGEYPNLLYGELRTELEKKKIAVQVVEEGGTVADADAADSIVVEGKVTDFKKAGHTMMHPGSLTMEINIYHRTDHSAVASTTPTLKLMPVAYSDDKTLAKVTGRWAADEIKKALK